jgi:hypothetical protein
MTPLRYAELLKSYGDAADSDDSTCSILPNIPCHFNDEEGKKELQTTRSARALATSPKSIENELVHDNSQGGWSDIEILAYFIGDCKSPDELLLDEQRQKRREKKDKQRHSNVRHRQRKQVQKRDLKLIVEDLEEKLQVLQDISHTRLYIHGPNQWEELMKAEKQKREKAEEEFQMLHYWIDAHDKLIQLYNKPNSPIG